MAGGGPDLFVVCKNCQAEVSPYITECPYCGHRLRKRAPKLDRGAPPARPPRGAKRRTDPDLPPVQARRKPRRERRERASYESSGRPYATMAIVLASIVLTLIAKADLVGYQHLWAGPPEDHWRRALTAPLVYVSVAYEMVALGCAFLFGWLLERRHGFWAPLLVFAAAGVGGMWVAQLLDPDTLALGANGAALGLLAAWAVPDLLARRRGEETGTDGLGVLVLAVLLILLPVAVVEAHSLAGVGGGLIGLLLGFALNAARSR